MISVFVMAAFCYCPFCGPMPGPAQGPGEEVGMVADPQEGWTPDFSFEGEPLQPLFDGDSGADYECPLAKAGWVHCFRVLRTYVSLFGRLPDRGTEWYGLSVGRWCVHTRARARAGMLSVDEIIVLRSLPYWDQQTRNWQKDGPFE